MLLHFTDLLNKPPLTTTARPWESRDYHHTFHRSRSGAQSQSFYRTNLLNRKRNFPTSLTSLTEQTARADVQLV